MNPFLDEIFTTGKYRNSENELIQIHSETSKEQCLYLQELIRANKCTNTLEIGFAYGMSTLAIVEMVAQQNGRHTVIDKFEMEDWKGNGLDLVRRAGYEDNLEFVGQFCYEVLPQFLREGRVFDFAYIDSTKQFDWLLVDFFYIDKMLKTGGIVVFDDVCFPSIRKLLRYISRFPSYRVHSQFPENERTSGIRGMAGMLKMLPRSEMLIRSEILVPDYELGLNANCIALQKVDDDKRGWDWHTDF